MNDVSTKVVEAWWKTNSKYTCRYDGHFTLRDVENGIDVATHWSMFEAKEQAYKLAHPGAPTSFDIRKFLIEDELRLVRLLGIPDLGAEQRMILEMFLTAVKEAIEAKVWMQ